MSHNYKFGDTVDDITALEVGDMFKWERVDDDIYHVGGNKHEGAFCSLFYAKDNRSSLDFAWTLKSEQYPTEAQKCYYMGNSSELLVTLVKLLNQKI